jgi:hypothetical protein
LVPKGSAQHARTFTCTHTRHTEPPPPPPPPPPHTARELCILHMLTKNTSVCGHDVVDVCAFVDTEEQTSKQANKLANKTNPAQKHAHPRYASTDVSPWRTCTPTDVAQQGLFSLRVASERHMLCSDGGTTAGRGRNRYASKAGNHSRAGLRSWTSTLQGEKHKGTATRGCCITLHTEHTG